MFTNEELVSLNILCRVYVEARSHDGKYYSRIGYYTENTNYTMFTDGVFITDSILTECSSRQMPLKMLTWSSSLVKSKNFSTKHKPAMIPRDFEILYEKKQLVLEQQAQSSANVSNFVAGSIQSQTVSKECALSKTIQWRFFRLQVQPRLLHRSFSASQTVHNCIFNIKYCSN